MMKLAKIISFFLALALPLSAGSQTFQWMTEYVTLDNADNGTGDRTSSVAVFAPNIFVALVTGAPTDGDIFNVSDNYLVGYWEADSTQGRVAPQPYSPSGQFEVWSSGLDEVTLTGAWQIAGGKHNYVYVANNDPNHNILVFELTQFGVISTKYRMETGPEPIFAIEVDTAGYVYVVDYLGSSEKTNEIKVFRPIDADGTTWGVPGGHNDTPVTTIDLPPGRYQGITVSSDGSQIFVSASSERSLWKFAGSPENGYTRDETFSYVLSDSDTVGFGGSGTPSLLGLAYLDDPGYVFAAVDTFIHIGNLGGYPYGRIYVIDGQTASPIDTIDIAQWNYDMTGVFNTGSNNGRVGGFTSVCDVDIEASEPAVYTQTYFGWAVEKWIYDGILAVPSHSNRLPEDFTLYQNYPNPFNPTTTISFDLAKTTHVRLRVYDASGRMVAELVNQKLQPGGYQVVFRGTGLASGTYFYELKADSYILRKKMLLLK